MQHHNGDVFSTTAKILAHGANIEGVMGAGVAKTLREKFPKNYNAYKFFCENGLAVAGEWYANNDDNPGELIVLNLFTQDKPGRNARYEWVAQSLLNFADFYSEQSFGFGKTIALPEIGSGIGGLEWDKVEEILHVVEFIYPDIEFEVWHYAVSN